jgi:hypothetical protein
MKYFLVALLPLLLADMIAVRETAMIEKDIETAMSQFSEDETWINSQGYYFEGRQNVLEFHGMLADSATRDYTYEEIGLMTLTAQKRNGRGLWIAVTIDEE